MHETARDPALFAQAFLGFTPHPGQVSWMRAPHRVKVACCGRRWGKSYASAADLVWFAITRPGTEQFVIAPTSDQARIIMRYVESMVLRIPGFRDSKDLRVQESPFPMVRILDSGIHGRSAGDSGQNVRGHGADRVLVDEAAYVPSPALDALLPLLATSRYGQQLYISTAFGKNHFWDLFVRGQSGDPDYVAFQFPSSDSPHVSAAYLAQQRAQMTDMAYRVEYGAEFAEDQNSVFRYSDIQAAIAGDIDTEPESDHRYVLGYDPAKYHDRSGVVVLDVSTSPWDVVAVQDIGGRDYLTQAAEIGRLASRYGNASVLMDATAHDQMLEHLTRDGVRVEGFRFSNQTKRELIDGLAIALERHEIRIPPHSGLLSELALYRYELTKAGNVKLGAPDTPGAYDDLVTALALAVQAGSQYRRRLPMSWLTEDPTFRAAVLGKEEEPRMIETEDQRRERRLKDFIASHGWQA